MSTRLEILIEAVDKANATLVQINDRINNIEKDTKKSSEENKKSSDAMEKNWLRVSVSVMGLVKAYRLVDQEFKRIVNITAAANPEFKSTIQNWERAVNDLALSIGNKLAPQIELVAGYWTNVLNDISGKNDKLVASQKQLIDTLKDYDYQLAQMEKARATPGITDDTMSGVAQYSNVIAARTAIIQQLHDLETTAMQEKEAEEVEALTRIQETYLTKELQKVDQLRMIWSLWNNEKTEMAMAQMQKETEFYTFAIDTQQKAHQTMWTTAGKLRDTFSAGLSKSIGTLIFDFENATDAVKNFGISLVQVLLDYMIQKATSFALSKTLLAGEVAAAAVSGAAIAQAWADAAAMVSLATFGANAIPAGAGITTTVALAHSLALPGLERGGDILRGGSVMVGERGPEILDLPAGARVTPLSGDGGREINLTVQIFSPIVTSEDTADRFAQDLAEKVSLIISREVER